MHVLAAGELPASKNKQLDVVWERARSAKSVARRCSAPVVRPAQGWPRTPLALAVAAPSLHAAPLFLHIV